MESARYGAFISYRHVAEDRRFAQRLHDELEAWTTPARLVEQGARIKVGRVFRDEEELAASSDLSAEIDSALRDSESLIVICSPLTPTSRWVNEEVQRFRALGRSHRILACLIKGEPSESFPPALFNAMDGSASEPLAADFRPPSDGSTAAAQRLAKLRLLAALIGCRFDDLVLREQARRRRRAAIGTAVLVGVSAVVSILGFTALQQRNAAENQRRVAEQRRDATLLTQSRFLSSLSSQALGEGHASLAALLALEALPREGSPEDRPYHSPAMSALYAAVLGQREQLTLGEGGLDGEAALTPTVSAVRFTTNGSQVIVGTTGGAVELWDIVSRRRVASVSLGNKPVVRLAFDRNDLRGFAASGAEVFEVDLGSGRAAPVASVEDAIESLTAHDSGSTFVTITVQGQRARAVRWTRGTEERFSAGPALEFGLDLLYHYTIRADGRQLGFGNAHMKGLILGDLVSGAKRLLLPPQLKSDTGTLFAAFSPSGDRLLVSGQRRVLLLDPALNQSPVELRGHQDVVLRAAFAADGRTVATGGEDGLVLLWGPENRYARPLRSFGGFRRGDNHALQQGAEIERTLLLPQRMRSLFEGAVGHLVFGADGAQLVVASGDRALSVFDLKGNMPPLRLGGHRGRIDDLAISADGKRLMSLDREGAARVWSTTRSKPMILSSGDSAVHDVFMPAGTAQPIALVRHSATRCGALWRAWTLGTSAPLGPKSAPMSTLSLDGRILLAGEPADGVLSRVDLEDGHATALELPGGIGSLDCAYVDPVHGGILLQADDGSVSRLPPRGRTTQPAISPSVHPDVAHPEVIKAWLRRTSPPKPDAGDRFLVNRDGDRALLWLNDGGVSLLDTRAGNELRRLTEHDYHVANKQSDDDGTGFAFSADGRLVLSLRKSGVRLWSAVDGGLLRDVPTIMGEPIFATVGGLPSRRLVVLEAERLVVHDLSSPQSTLERPMRFESVAVAQLSHDGQQLAVGGGEPCGTLWRTDTLTKVADLALPAGCPTSFAFSPDDTTLLTTVWEPQGLALWDARGGAQLVRHGGCIAEGTEMGDADPSDVMTAGFSADGAHVFVGTLGGVVCVWPHPGGGPALMAHARRTLSRGLSAAEQSRLPVQPVLPR